MFCVRDPSANPGVDGASLDRAGAPPITKTAQPVTETSDVVLWQAATAVVVQHETEKMCGIGCWYDLRFAGMQP